MTKDVEASLNNNKFKKIYITSLSGRKHVIFQLLAIKVYECMPLYDVITTDFVVLRAERIGSKRLILPWIGSCPG